MEGSFPKEEFVKGEVTKEKQWVESFANRLASGLQYCRLADNQLEVTSGKKLPDTCQIQEYSPDGSNRPETTSYETDLLIFDKSPDGHWVPRIVVECKLGHITTHDSLTYSTKAATHKNVHPYLRYGILIGNHKDAAIPGRLIKHGVYFDFMVSWKGIEPEESEWSGFCKLLANEIEASRKRTSSPASAFAQRPMLR